MEYKTIRHINTYKLLAFLFGIYLQYDHCLMQTAIKDFRTRTAQFRSYTLDDQFVMVFYVLLPLPIGWLYTRGSQVWTRLAERLTELDFMKKIADFKFAYMMASLNRAKLGMLATRQDDDDENEI